MSDAIEYEVFEEDKPSYLPVYLMSVFVLLGLVTLGQRPLPLWPVSIAHFFWAIWFGIFFYWTLGYSRQQKTFMSHRLRVANGVFRHTFRYAVAEAEHVEIPLAEIVEVKVSSQEPRSILLTGKSDFDIYFLPASADLEQILAAIKSGNPDVRIQRDHGASLSTP